MGKWVHGDEFCPRRPFFGKRAGRLYECSCGRVWRCRWRDSGVLGGGYWYWQLVPAQNPAPRIGTEKVHKW